MMNTLLVLNTTRILDLSRCLGRMADRLKGLRGKKRSKAPLKSRSAHAKRVKHDHVAQRATA